MLTKAKPAAKPAAKSQSAASAKGARAASPSPRLGGSSKTPRPAQRPLASAALCCRARCTRCPRPSPAHGHPQRPPTGPHCAPRQPQANPHPPTPPQARPPPTRRSWSKTPAAAAATPRLRARRPSPSRSSPRQQPLSPLLPRRAHLPWLCASGSSLLAAAQRAARRARLLRRRPKLGPSMGPLMSGRARQVRATYSRCPSEATPTQSAGRQTARRPAVCTAPLTRPFYLSPGASSQHRPTETHTPHILCHPPTPLLGRSWQAHAARDEDILQRRWGGGHG